MTSSSLRILFSTAVLAGAGYLLWHHGRDADHAAKTVTTAGGSIAGGGAARIVDGIPVDAAPASPPVPQPPAPAAAKPAREDRQATPAILPDDPREPGTGASWLAMPEPGTRLRAELDALPPAARVVALARLASARLPKADAGSLHLTGGGEIYYACAQAGHAHAANGAPGTGEGPMEPPRAAAMFAAAVPISAPPVRHSRYGAKNKIYLDFNGHTVTGTKWNLARSGEIAVPSYVAVPFDRDGNRMTFSPTEQAAIVEIWERVAEDFAPFDVDVTTVEPVDFGDAIRAVFTNSSDANGVSMPGIGATGIALFDSFGSNDPVFIYSTFLVSAQADVASHELGHAFGLRHDGDQKNTAKQRSLDDTGEYYVGHDGPDGWWSSLMGGPSLGNTTQWSRGEYFGAANFEDDLAVIAARLGYRADDVGDTLATATGVTAASGRFSANGIIGRESDTDVFSFGTGAGAFSVTAAPYRAPGGTAGGNLNVKLELLDARGAVLATSDPTATYLAVMSMNLAAGRYYLRVSSAGVGNPYANPATGYVRYGSLGRYSLLGAVVAAMPAMDEFAPVRAVLGEPFESLIGADNGPVRFEATGLPAGLTINERSGLIRGTPTAAGVFSISVRASNALGTATRTFVLTVGTTRSPAILNSPRDRSVIAGIPAVFSVLASGLPTPSVYKWQRKPAGNTLWTDVVNGVNFSGATTNSLTALAPVRAMNGDQFRCVVGNGAAPDAISAAGILTVLPAVTLVNIAGVSGGTGHVDGSGSAARFGQLRGLALDASGALWASDYQFYTIRKITAAGVTSTVAGRPAGWGYLDGQGASARFSGLGGVAFAPDGNFYVCDTDNHLIRKVAPAGLVSTIAGSVGERGDADGTGPSARFSYPKGIAVDHAGILYVTSGGSIRKITPDGRVSTLAGSFAFEERDGFPTSATFYNPDGIAVDRVGNLYVGGRSQRLRKVAPDGMVSTMSRFAGAGLRASDYIVDVAVDSRGSVFVLIGNNVRYVSPDGSSIVIAGVDSSASRLVFDASDNLFVAFSTELKKSTPATNLIPITISAHPQSRTVVSGSAVTLSVSATSPAAMTYRWRKDGVAISGATAAALELTNVNAASQGSYTVTVANSTVAVESDPALLAVESAAVKLAGLVREHPVDRTLPALHATLPLGYPTTFSVSVDPTQPTTLQWQRLAAGSATWTNLSDGENYAGTASAVLTVSVAAAANAGDRFRCAVTGPGGVVNSFAATLWVELSAPLVIAAPQPQSQTVEDNNQTVTYAVVAEGTEPLRYQWRNGSRVIAGATNAVYSFAAVRNPSSQLYYSFDVEVSNSVGSVISDRAELKIIESKPVIDTQPVGQSAIAGSRVTFSVSATGSGPFFVDWRFNGRVVSSTTVASGAVASYTLPAVSVANAGTYRVDLFTAGRSLSTSSNTVTLTVTEPPSDPGRLVNLSILTSLDAPGDTFTVGAVVGGANTVGTKPLLVRAAGPALAQLGVGGVLGDPKLELFAGASRVGENDNWGGATQLSAVFVQVAAFPFASASSRDAAIYQPALAKGDHTVTVSGVGGTTGTVIMELYDATPNAAFTLTTPRLVNVSVLKPIGAGLTAGFVIGGATARTVLVRAIGPGLAAFGVGGTVGDPQLALFRGATQVAANDNWGGTAALKTAFSGVGAFALTDASRDAALVATLQPGNYTVQVSGVGGATGTALVEVYEVP